MIFWNVGKLDALACQHSRLSMLWTLYRSREFMLAQYIRHIRPILEFGSCFRKMAYISDMKLLENVQRRWTKRIDGFENLTYSHRLKDLNLFSIPGRLLRADVIKYWKIFHRKCGMCPEDKFVSARSGITRGHRFKISHDIFSNFYIIHYNATLNAR